MKPTPRRSGRHAITVQSEHYLDSGDVAAILAYAVEVDYADDGDPILPTMSRAGAERTIRDTLRRRGNEWYWNEIVDPDEVEDRARWAAATVRRLWPVLDDAELTRFEKSYIKD